MMATRNLLVRILAKDEASKVFKGLGQNVSDVGKTMLGMLGASSIQNVLRGATQGIKNFANSAGQISQVSQAFERLAHTVGLSSQQWLADLRAGAQGTISDLKLMQTANTATLLAGSFMAK